MGYIDIKKYNLEDILPTITIDCNNSSEEEGISEWVKEKAKQGLIGEKKVKEFLEKERNAKVVKMKDSAGYDYKTIISGEEVFIEVKTSSKGHFYMSRNEIENARDSASKYYIYYVVTEGSGANTICKKLYVMKNPYNKLEFNWIFNVQIPNNIANMRIASIEVEVNDFEGFEEIKAFKKYID